MDESHKNKNPEIQIYRSEVNQCDYIWASTQENLTLLHVNNKGADQSTHPHSLIRTFGICNLEYKIVKLAQGKISIPSAESFKKDCCQLQAKVCARSTG